MKSLNSRLVLSTLGIALLATPVLAHSMRHRHVHHYGAHRHAYSHPRQYQYGYPPQSGYSYTPQYVPGFGNLGATGGGVSDSCC
jgi:hypothetical protein